MKVDTRTPLTQVFKDLSLDSSITVIYSMARYTNLILQLNNFTEFLFICC